MSEHSLSQQNSRRSSKDGRTVRITSYPNVTPGCVRYLILVAAPYTPHMSIFDYLNTLSNGRFLINFLTVLPSRRPQLISVFNDHE